MAGSGVAHGPEHNHFAKAGGSKLIKEGAAFFGTGDSGKPVVLAGLDLGRFTGLFCNYPRTILDLGTLVQSNLLLRYCHILLGSGLAVRCAKCRSENPVGKKFCTQCGSALAAVCPSCGAENPPSSRFCGDCGVELSPGSAGKQAPSSALGTPGIRVSAGEAVTSAAADGERKTVTALFADIKGSMELMEDLDPEAWHGRASPLIGLAVRELTKGRNTNGQTRWWITRWASATGQ